MGSKRDELFGGRVVNKRLFKKMKLSREEKLG